MSANEQDSVSATDGLEAARAALEGGETVRGPQADPDPANDGAASTNFEAEHMAGSDAGGHSGNSKGWRKRLAECPITPLGMFDDAYFYLDALRQLRSLRADKHGRLNLQGLLGDKVWWAWNTYPRFNKDGDRTGWHAEHLAEDLMRACAAAGVWHSADRERGRGAWMGDEGELILHCGDQIVIRSLPESGDPSDAVTERKMPPGIIGWHVYPAGPSLPLPIAPQFGTPENVSRAFSEVLTLLKTWNWRRKEADARIMLGWIAAGMIGGALKWRPAIWVTGGSGTGKSTLQELLNGLFGRGALERTADTTAAGVRQLLGKATLPVAFEESESSEDNRAINAVVKFARLAASGGRVLRGGQDHKEAEFQARSCFQFASILIPPLTPQDRSRIAVLDLEKLPANAKEPKLDYATLHQAGLMMRRRLLDAWPELPRRLRAFREKLIERGHTARGADQYGTLLALADLLLEADLPDCSAAWDAVLEGFSAEELGLTGDEGDGDDKQCIGHLATTVIDTGRSSERRTVAGWATYAFGGENSYQMGERRSEANKALGLFGIRLVHERGVEWLAVANRHRTLSTLFESTRWQTLPGATGGWVQSLRRVAGAESRDGLRFDGANIRCTLVPLTSFLPDDLVKQSSLALSASSSSPTPTPAAES